MTEIYIKRFHYPEEGRLYSILGMTGDYKRAYRGTDDPNMVDVVKLEESVQKSLKEINLKLDELFTSYKRLIGSCWLMSSVSEDGLRTPIAYIRPYRLVTANQLLFMLYTSVGNDINRQKVALVDEGFDVIELSKTHDLVFIEATMDELLEQANKNCQEMVNERLYKIDHVADYK